eukprot:COSAG01_NODE_2218_length_8146_cov_7.810015_1_plen_114_part_10
MQLYRPEPSHLKSKKYKVLKLLGVGVGVGVGLAQRFEVDNAWDLRINGASRIGWDLCIGPRLLGLAHRLGRRPRSRDLGRRPAYSVYTDLAVVKPDGRYIKLYIAVDGVVEALK